MSDKRESAVQWLREYLNASDLDASEFQEQVRQFIARMAKHRKRNEQR